MVSTKYTVSRDGSDPNAAGNHRKNLRLSLDTSLRRLRTDYIDLYWVHLWDAHTPIEETMRALDYVVRDGKDLYVGVSPGTLTERDLAVARSVDEIATEVGASASQVAIAWTRARTDAVHPIIGAHRLDQLLDNLAAVDCTLPAEALRRLDDASDFVAGFPTDFINETSPWVFGEASARVDPP